MKTLLVIFCCLIAVACSKNKTAGNKTSLLTAHPWKLKTSITTPGLRRTSRDTAFSDNSPEDPCDVDNTFQFYKDGTAAIHSGTVHCSPNEVQSITGTWKFINDGEKLRFHLNGIIGGGYAYTYDTLYTITELSENTLTLSHAFHWAWTNQLHTEVETFGK